MSHSEKPKFLNPKSQEIKKGGRLALSISSREGCQPQISYVLGIVFPFLYCNKKWYGMVIQAEIYLYLPMSLWHYCLCFALYSSFGRTAFIFWNQTSYVPYQHELTCRAGVTKSHLTTRECGFHDRCKWNATWHTPYVLLSPLWASIQPNVQSAIWVAILSYHYMFRSCPNRPH